MTTLKNVIAALQREIDAALKGAADANLRTRLAADRVILKLEVTLNEKHTADGSSELEFDVVTTDSDATSARTHSLTIEFKPAIPESPQAALLPSPTESVATASSGPVRLQDTESEHVIAELSSVFGAPGFDSSARATVFREIFTALNAAQVSNLVASFSGSLSSDENSALRNPIHRINGILRSGPQRSPEAGRKILARVFSRRPPLPILKLIEEKWKTQEDWLDTPIQTSKPAQS